MTDAKILISRACDSFHPQLWRNDVCRECFKKEREHESSRSLISAIKDEGRNTLKSTNSVSKFLTSIVESKSSKQSKIPPKSQILKDRVLNEIPPTNPKPICKKDHSSSTKTLESRKSIPPDKKITLPKSKVDSEKIKRTKVESTLKSCLESKKKNISSSSTKSNIRPASAPTSKLETVPTSRPSSASLLFLKPLPTKLSPSKEKPATSSTPDSKLSKSKSLYQHIHKMNTSFSPISPPTSKLVSEYGNRFRREIENIQVPNVTPLNMECIRADPWVNIEVFQILNYLEGRNEQDMKVNVHEIYL